MKDVAPELLRDAVFELVAECRQNLHSGRVDVAQVDRGVRAYCEAVAALPRDEGRRYAPDLEALMESVTALSDELVAARDAVKVELKALADLKRANVAYQRSDAVGIIYKPSDGDS